MTKTNLIVGIGAMIMMMASPRIPNETWYNYDKVEGTTYSIREENYLTNNGKREKLNETNYRITLTEDEDESFRNNEMSLHEIIKNHYAGD